jgi:heme biosynthesis-associated TPR repeat protein
MIKHLFYFILISIITVSLGVLFTGDPGYILIIFKQWQIQTSLVVILLSIITILFLFKFAVELVKILCFLPAKITKAIRSIRFHSQEKQLEKGMEAYFQEQWQDAVLQLQHQPHKEMWPVQLLAAEAAQNEGKLEIRDQFIENALLSSPKTRNSILLFQAKLQFNQKQFEQAQATLNSLPLDFQSQSTPWNLLQLKLDEHFQQDEVGLQRLKAKKSLLQRHPQFEEFYLTFLTNCIKKAIQNQKVEQAYTLYKQAPKNIQLSPVLLLTLAPHLDINQKAQKDIYKQIKKTLKIQIDNRLLQNIVDYPERQDWLSFLEKLTEHHPRHALLFTVIGQLKAKQKLWGSALASLRTSIEIHPTSLAYSEMANIYTQLEQHDDSIIAMQNALELVV